MLPATNVRAAALLACIGAAILLAGAGALRAAEGAATPAQLPTRETIRIQSKDYIVFTAEELRAKGIPYLELKPEENAATYYLKAFDSVHEPYNKPDGSWDKEKDAQVSHIYRYGWGEEFAEIAAVVKSNDAAVEVIKKALAIKQWQFPVCHDRKSDSPILPYLGALRGCSRMLTLRAQWKAGSGDFDGAIECAAMTFGLAHQMSNEPFGVGELVRQALVEMAASSCVSLMTHYDLGEKQLKAIATLLDKNWEVRPTYLALLKKDEAREENLRPYLKRFEKLDTMDAFEVAPWKWDFNEEQKLPEEYLQGVPKTLQFNIRMLPNGRLGFAKMDTNLQLARTIAALHLYRKEKGQFPKALADLTPAYMKAVPIDTYNPQRKPLTYRLADKGYALYSVGEDGKDDYSGDDPPGVTPSGAIEWKDVGNVYPPAEYKKYVSPSTQADPLAKKIEDEATKLADEAMAKARAAADRGIERAKAAGEAVDEEQVYRKFFGELLKPIDEMAKPDTPREKK